MVAITFGLKIACLSLGFFYYVEGKKVQKTTYSTIASNTIQCIFVELYHIHLYLVLNILFLGFTDFNEFYSNRGMCPSSCCCCDALLQSVIFILLLCIL